MSTCEVNGQQFRCFLLPSWQIRRLSYQPPVLDEVFSLLRVSRHIYTSGIPAQLSISVYVHTMTDSQARLKPRLLPTFKAKLVCCFNAEGFNFVACFEVIILKNRIERAL